ncbi:MAG TPA: NYN domain-containing protein [Nocardioides sp.]|jgi:uncharacterized protein|nr:NYN domain-containing protein [Nocardioides sp.]
MSERRTFLLIDGENIDATLGTALFQRRPQPEERPRWERLTAFAESTWNQPAVGLFFLNATNGQMPLSFVQALLAMGFRPIPLAGGADEKVVDIGIQRTLDALKTHEADVLLCSHDGDFAPQLRALDDGRRLGLLALREYVSGQLTALEIPVFDLEDDVGAFNATLPRTRIISLDDFDPESFLR